MRCCFWNNLRSSYPSSEFVFGFVLLQYTKKNKRWRRYFRKEFKIDKRIIEEGEIGAKIKDIYSYRLGQLHARRGLLASLILSFITIIVMVLYIDTSYINDKTLILSAINGLLIMIMLINYHYFDRNLDYFMTRINDLKIR
ncbi:BA5345 family protein [Bacillus velezensis]